MCLSNSWFFSKKQKQLLIHGNSYDSVTAWRKIRLNNTLMLDLHTKALEHGGLVSNSGYAVSETSFNLSFLEYIEDNNS